MNDAMQVVQFCAILSVCGSVVRFAYFVFAKRNAGLTHVLTEVFGGFVAGTVLGYIMDTWQHSEPLTMSVSFGVALLIDQRIIEQLRTIVTARILRILKAEPPAVKPEQEEPK